MRVSARIQFIVGLFVCFVIGCFVYLSLSVGFKFGDSAKSYYSVSATFTNVNGLKDNAQVKIGGLAVGYVESITLDPVTYLPVVKIAINKEYNEIPENSSLAIRTNGILGDKYLALIVGFSAPGFPNLKDGSVIQNTTPSVDLEDLISKFAFSSGK